MTESDLLRYSWDWERDEDKARSYLEGGLGYLKMVGIMKMNPNAAP